jgi:hypothetical protein
VSGFWLCPGPGEKPVWINRITAIEIGRHGVPEFTFTACEDGSYDIECALRSAEAPEWLS